MYIYVYIYIYVCMYVCMYVCIYRLARISQESALYSNMLLYSANIVAIWLY